jgi:hypothetical protein
MIKFLLISLCLIGTAFAGTRDPNTPDEKYIEYGKKYKCVLKLCTKTKDEKTAYASAVAIGSNWLLTAAHVLDDTHDPYIFIEDKKYEIDKFIIPKEFNDSFGYYDIAICHTKEDMKLNYYPELYENDDEVGKISGISGWGVTGTFDKGRNEEGGEFIRRAGSNKIDEIDRHLLICSPSLTNKTELEFIISHGDSGGGLFIDQKLAGINSCVMATDKKPNSNYGDEAGHTRVSLHRKWILDTIKNY